MLILGRKCRFAALEYHKSFDDVSADHWASGVILHMAAKHVIAGITDTSFAPGRAVTRAQFSAFMARALELESSGTPAFAESAQVVSLLLDR